MLTTFKSMALKLSASSPIGTFGLFSIPNIYADVSFHGMYSG